MSIDGEVAGHPAGSNQRLSPQIPSPHRGARGGNMQRSCAPTVARTNMSSVLDESPWSPSDWCSTEIRVRYAETDQMGVVYYSNYLVWFEVGRTEFCRQRSLPYRDFEREFQAYLAVAEAQCRYLTPARYDDVLIIRTRVDSFRKRTISFQYEIVNKESGLVVASGRTLHVLLDENGRPRSFPADFLRVMRLDEMFASGSEKLPESAK